MSVKSLFRYYQNKNLIGAYEFYCLIMMNRPVSTWTKLLSQIIINEITINQIIINAFYLPLKVNKIRNVLIKLIHFNLHLFHHGLEVK